jgi:peroxiredoxin
VFNGVGNRQTQNLKQLTKEIMKILIGWCLILAFSIVSFGQESKTKPLAKTFSATSLGGQTFDLAELKGKVVVLTFWSTRCPICRDEIPKLNQLVKIYKDKDVVFLGLTMEGPTKVEAYLKRKPFDFTIIPNSFGVVLKYAEKVGNGNISLGFPSHFVVNRKGEIELKTNGFDKTPAIESQIRRLLSLN